MAGRRARPGNRVSKAGSGGPQVPRRGAPARAGEALSREEAVRAATVTAAASLGASGAGGLQPGQRADLVICDGDPFTPATQVTQTWVAGTVAWSG